MAKHRLTHKKVTDAKPGAKPYRLSDGDNLYLYVAPSGVKSWQMRYRNRDGKEQVATLGKLAKLSLAEARTKAQEWGSLADAGENLTAHKHAEKAKRHADSANTFKDYADKWIERTARREGWGELHKAQVTASLANHLNKLDRLPIAKITAANVSPIIRAVEGRAPTAADRARRYLRAILDDAVEGGLIPANPLPTARRRQNPQGAHYAAVTALAPLGAILRSADASDPCKGAQRAHALLVFTAMRVSNVVAAKWEEFELDGVDVPIGDSHKTRHDPDAGNWTIPREALKKKDQQRGAHIVPLPPALLKQLREWRKTDGEGSVYVCPAPRDPKQHIGPNTIGKHYRHVLKMRGQHSPHSWRSAFSTICREAGKDSDTIEAQLDHVVGNNVAAAYDRAARIELRRELMAWYEQTLIAARDGADVIPISKSRA